MPIVGAEKLGQVRLHRRMVEEAGEARVGVDHARDWPVDVMLQALGLGGVERVYIGVLGCISPLAILGYLARIERAAHMQIALQVEQEPLVVSDAHGKAPSTRRHTGCPRIWPRIHEWQRLGSISCW
ncbi:MAG: hypothetical protein H7Y32_12005 [Chloroflexales bacterium]|nr:hypothetical protein [Chloroflexales bacterium]